MKQLIINAPYKQGASLVLTGKQYVYLVKVLRKRVGECVLVRFSDEVQYEYEVEKIDERKKSLILHQSSNENALTSLPETKAKFYPTVKLILLQWLLKGSKFDTVVKQATQVGVSAIFPVCGDFSVPHSVSSAKEDRFSRVITEARQQSGSSVNTSVFEATSLEKTLANLEAFLAREKLSGTASEQSTKRIVFTEKSDSTKLLHECLSVPADVVVLAIGCEGGISESEYELLRNAGFTQCHLQTNILRAETASLYALASVQTITEEKIWQLKELN